MIHFHCVFGEIQCFCFIFPANSFLIRYSRESEIKNKSKKPLHVWRWKVNLSLIFLHVVLFKSIFLCSFFVWHCAVLFCFILQFFNRKLIYHFFYCFENISSIWATSHDVSPSVNEKGICELWSFKFICTRCSIRCLRYTRIPEKSDALNLFNSFSFGLLSASFAGQRFMKGSIRYIITWTHFPNLFLRSRPVQLFTFHSMHWLNCTRNCIHLTIMGEGSMQLQRFSH